MTSRRSALVGLAALLLVACGGAPSTLRALGKPTGTGPANLEVKNATDVMIESFHLAESEHVEQARAAGVAPGSDEDLALWGEDFLDHKGIAPGETVKIGELRSGRYDALVTDPDGREQLVKRLDLKRGGRYVLELTDSGWQMAR
jgi:hypothetical protein